MVAEPPIETLPDAQVLALCPAEMLPESANELNSLLDAQREGRLDGASRIQLDSLIQIYRHALVRKAQALQVAHARGLRPPLP